MRSLLIGDNSFIGVSHLAQSKARETMSRLNIPAMANVVDEAIQNGASGFSFSTHPTNQKILQRLHEEDLPKRSFDIYPILPYAEGYVRLANEVGMVGIIKHFMSDLSLTSKTKTLLKGGISAVTFDPVKLLKFYIEVEVERYLRIKPKTATLRSILLHEVVTDLALAFNSRELFTEYDKHIRNKFHVIPGYVTRNFARFVRFFHESDMSLDDTVIMTPFNKAGFQMNPSRESCETALSSLNREVNVIAMSALAGGYLALDEAVDYLRSLPKLSGTIVGVSSTQHAQTTFRAFSKLLNHHDN
ncbi:MAG TPA: hypothetical protein VJZ75_00325 [Candidatus Bathyarchaeia archaeon]|nr:hypothetical protein [Candidatus Bathyarchaeia archaeon]